MVKTSSVVPHGTSPTIGVCSRGATRRPAAHCIRDGLDPSLFPRRSSNTMACMALILTETYHPFSNMCFLSKLFERINCP